tara:strand:+ start:69 stop:440 length:372 start_codon:yes stop_codon:yes gene_type:complete
MDAVAFLLLTIIGILSGGLAALVGGGADVLIVPMLLLFRIFSNIKRAVGTSLLMLMPPVTIFAAYTYYKAGDVNIWYALYLGIIYAISSLVVSKIGVNAPKKILKKGYSIFIIIVGIILWFSK